MPAVTAYRILRSRYGWLEEVAAVFDCGGTSNISSEMGVSRINLVENNSPLTSLLTDLDGLLLVFFVFDIINVEGILFTLKRELLK